MIADSELTYLNPKLMWKAHLSTRQARISDKSNFALTFSQQIKYIEQANEKALLLKIIGLLINKIIMYLRGSTVSKCALNPVLYQEARLEWNFIRMYLPLEYTADSLLNKLYPW